MEYTRPPHKWGDTPNWQLKEPTQAEMGDETTLAIYLGSLYQVVDWNIPLKSPRGKYLRMESFFMVTKFEIEHGAGNLNNTFVTIRAFCDETEVEFSISALVWKRYIRKVA